VTIVVKPTQVAASAHRESGGSEFDPNINNNSAKRK